MNNVVHEADTQRQYVRIPLQAKAMVEGIECVVHDWSNGGMAIEAIEQSVTLSDKLNKNTHYTIELDFSFDGFSLVSSFSCVVVYLDAKSKRVGCRFDNLTRVQLDLVRYFTTAYLSGEIVKAGDILDVAARNNTSKPRSVPKEEKQTISHTIRRKIIPYSGIALLITALLSYITVALYEQWFVLRASSAQVTSEMLSIDAPAGGKVYYEPIKIDTQVQPGVPLLSVFTANDNVITIDSPCQCIVKKRLLENNRLARKGEPLLELISPDTQAFIEGYMAQKDAVRIKIGDEALLSLSGQDAYLRGTVSNIQAGKSLGGNSRITIIPNEMLPVDYIDDPVDIRIDTLKLF